MRVLTLLTCTLSLVIFLSQCKKNNTVNLPGTPQDTGKAITDGRYIIRTKYICEDGGAFVLRSASNYELITWEWTVPENLQSQKNDEQYIWDVKNGVPTGPGVAALPSNSYAAGAVKRYQIYQRLPNGDYHYFLNPVGESLDDQLGYGKGPSAPASIFSNNGPYTDFYSGDPALEPTEVHTLMHVYSITDSTYRIGAWDSPLKSWWYFSMEHDPQSSDCSTFHETPFWRNTWICPNSGATGSVWKSDFCCISQLVFEKVN